MKAEWRQKNDLFHLYGPDYPVLGQVWASGHTDPPAMWRAQITLQTPFINGEEEIKHFGTLDEAKTFIEKTIEDKIRQLAAYIGGRIIPEKAVFTTAIPDCIDVVDTIGGSYSPWAFGHEEEGAIDEDRIEEIWQAWRKTEAAEDLEGTDLFDGFMVHLGNLGYVFVTIGGGMLSIGSFDEGEYNALGEEPGVDWHQIF
jgi:hypothetical protein